MEVSSGFPSGAQSCLRFFFFEDLYTLVMANKYVNSVLLRWVRENKVNSRTGHEFP